jgi:FkbM family methyltransferase
MKLAPELMNFMLRAIPWSWRSRIRNIPVLARLNRIIVAGALHGKEFIHQVDAGPAKGIRFQISLPEDKGIWTGTYETHFAAEVGAAVERGAVTYDVGGWHGFFAGVMAARGAREIHVFEPLAKNADRIRRLIELNPQFVIRLHQCALGDQDEEADLLVMPQTSMAKLSVSTFQSTQMATSQVRVKIAKIDTLIAGAKLAPPNLIKIDVEGAETFVLRGAMNTLREFRPAIFAEVHSSMLLRECSNLLDALGYAVRVMDNSIDEAHRRDVFQIQAMTMR